MKDFKKKKIHFFIYNIIFYFFIKKYDDFEDRQSFTSNNDEVVINVNNTSSTEDGNESIALSHTGLTHHYDKKSEKRKTISYLHILSNRFLYNLFNIILLILSYLILTGYLSLSLTIIVPISFIISALHAMTPFIVLFYYSYQYLYLDLRDYSGFSLLNRTIHMLSLTIITFLGSILITAIFMALYVIVIAVVLAILLVGQPILWPIIEALKTFIIFNRIINSYCRGLVKERHQTTIDLKDLSQKETNDKHKPVNEDSVKIDIPSDHQDNISKENNNINNTSNNNNGNNNNNVNDENKKGKNIASLESISSLSFIGSIKNLMIPTSSPSLVQDIFCTEPFTIPPSYFEDKSLLSMLLSIWWYRLKKIVIFGTKWNILLLYPLGYLLVLLPDVTRKFIIRRYECGRFLWYRK